jgi:hypothetical protein
LFLSLNSLEVSVLWVWFSISFLTSLFLYDEIKRAFWWESSFFCLADIQWTLMLFGFWLTGSILNIFSPLQMTTTTTRPSSFPIESIKIFELRLFFLFDSHFLSLFLSFCTLIGFSNIVHLYLKCFVHVKDVSLLLHLL